MKLTLQIMRMTTHPMDKCHLDKSGSEDITVHVDTNIIEIANSEKLHGVNVD